MHGGQVDEIVASQVIGAWYNHHYDAQGSCILLSTATGGLQEQYDYDAFGYPYFYTPSGGKGGNVKTRFLFTGREWISDMRIYDYRARMYQPEPGRFLQPDPKEFDGGDYNLYRYCHNDPVNKSDSTGLREEAVGEIMRDRIWDFACRMDSGNSFQGDYNEFFNQWHDHTSMGQGESAPKRKSEGATGSARGKQGFVDSLRETLHKPEVQMAMETAIPAGRGAGILKGFGRLIARIFGNSAPSISASVLRQMATRGWTQAAIEQAIRSGKQVPAINKATGNAATRYIHPVTGQSVVVDKVTKEVIHVGGPGFLYGPAGGDLP